MTERYQEFPKIPRLSREMLITEKLDGTNAKVEIVDINGLVDVNGDLAIGPGIYVEHEGRQYTVRAGSRTRWITSHDDNFGFARFVQERAEQFVRLLGSGTHFGEWYGQGIQRGYGLKEKRFALFNVERWQGKELPERVETVPLLMRWSKFDTSVIEFELENLRLHGSFAVPGFMKPEGIVILHKQGNVLFKKTLEKDEEHKSNVK